jgi:rhodanese-related sulfurtransferase
VRHVELDPDRPVVCICHHGIRSASAAGALAHLGFAQVWNLSGGIDRWAAEIDPAMRRY